MFGGASRRSFSENGQADTLKNTDFGFQNGFFGGGAQRRPVGWFNVFQRERLKIVPENQLTPPEFASL